MIIHELKYLKLRTLLVACATVFALSACGGDTPDTPDDPTSETDPTGGNNSDDKKPTEPEDTDPFYAWKSIETFSPAKGVKYTCYSFTNISERVHVVEVDLTDEAISIETSISNGLVPNPNGNNNSNNGPCLRETLRENVMRRRNERHNVVAAINTGFFDSHYGIPRGVHVEDGEIMFMNNPDVRARLTKHVWGIGVYADRSISFDARTIKASVRTATQDVMEVYSINDTIVALRGKPTYDVNVYTHRYAAKPQTGMTNPIGTKALFIVVRGDEPLAVNKGYQRGVITAIIDGRSKSVEAPYVTRPGEWVLQVTGGKGDKLASSLTVGDGIEISTTLTLGNKAAPMTMYNAGMFHYVYRGAYEAPALAEDADKIYQTMNIGINRDRTRLYLYAIDGVKTYRGLNFYEAYRVARKLGVYDAVRFDGGGSTTMWLLDGGVEGRVVNNITDSKGERSCLNYLHITRRQ